MHKVRKSTTKFHKTTMPHEKYLDDDDDNCTQGTRRPSSEEFAVLPEGFQNRRSLRLEGNKHEDHQERPRRRLVYFDEEVLVRRVRPVFEIGGKIDCRELWYQEDEYKEIMWKAKKNIKRARNSEDPDAEKYCLRGLEYISASSEQKRSNLDGREAVLDEQFDQFEKDVFPLDDDRIASVYVPHTKGHRLEAYERASADAKEVAVYRKQHDGPPLQPARMASVNSHSSSTSSLNSISSAGASMVINKPGLLFTHVDKTI